MSKKVIDFQKAGFNVLERKHMIATQKVFQSQSVEEADKHCAEASKYYDKMSRIVHSKRPKR